VKDKAIHSWIFVFELAILLSSIFAFDLVSKNLSESQSIKFPPAEILEQDGGCTAVRDR